MWDLVYSKFQNLRENIASRFEAFHSVTNVSAHSLGKLKALQEIVKSTPRSLQDLGHKTDGWNDLYVDGVLRKLDQEAHMILADRLAIDKDPITIT